MFLLGYDIGSSSVKASLVDVEKRTAVDTVQTPEGEMEIISERPGWAEQDPEMWWDNLCKATKKLLLQNSVSAEDIQGIGIAYQMHGLVLIDKDQKVLRPAIIWCDSRAVDIGNKAFTEIGGDKCLHQLLNSPGNFTASKLRWVKENEPELFDRVDKFLLPGDYIAMRLTREVNTTIPALSEGIFWDFKNQEIASFLLEYFEMDQGLIPEVVPTFSIHGRLTKESSLILGLKEGTPVSYRSGDQPNNAMALNVLKPGEIAATGGTSGVVYGIVDEPVFDHKSRVNAFAHVNYDQNNPNIGVLLCINGAGIQYSWMKNNIARDGITYSELEKIISTVPVSSDGLRIIPFGNGAERILDNRNIGCQILNLHFNTHSTPHLYRAALEGIAFSFVYGMEILNEMGINVNVMRVGNDNLFQSEVFSTTIATLINCEIEVVETTGAVGAAKAAGVSLGVYSSLEESMGNLDIVKKHEPSSSKDVYENAFQAWKSDLEQILNQDKI